MPDDHAPGYYRRRYLLLREQLFSLLGNRCASCSATEEGGTQLFVDHIDGREYEVRRVASHTRMKRYLDEYRSGVRLQLLCKACDPDQNGKGLKGAGERARRESDLPEEPPF